MAPTLDRLALLQHKLNSVPERQQIITERVQHADPAAEKTAQFGDAVLFDSPTQRITVALLSPFFYPKRFDNDFLSQEFKAVDLAKGTFGGWQSP